ncbi:MAG: type II secretion system GspH family protein [Synergistaceae bacterium]|nr:type II secretion system GspH family protein [Synergistaceae bacterium]
MLKRSKGFTLLEVLVAVAILGLVAAGSLRLMIISSRTLIEVDETRELLNETRKIQLDFITDETKPTSGTEGKYKWDTKEGSWSMLDGQWELKYKELKVETANSEIVLYMPIY